MTLRYLNFTASTNVVNGHATVQGSPPSGQYWIPRMVRVGISYTDQTLYPFPTNSFIDYFCTLYHGGTGDKNIDAFIDGTSSGLGDVTSILNGTLIQNGEFLTANWNVLDLDQNHTPASGATAYMQIIGLTADTITEVTEVLGTAQPGPRFSTPLVDLLNVPPAPSEGTLRIFTNPGQNNTVQLIAATPLYLYNVSILTSATLVNGDGVLQASPTDNTWRWAYFNPGISGNDVPQTWDFHGMKLSLGGLWWLQTGNAASGAVSYAIDFAYRAMAI